MRTDGRLDLRAIAESDASFLRGLYASTRAAEMAMVPWSGAQKAAFLDMQFDAQHRYYQEHYGDAAFDLILLDGEPAGRLYVQRKPREIVLIDVALMPRFRQRGIGGVLMKGLLEEARAGDRPIRLHVEHENPARAWYLRLGFRDVEDRGVYIFMEWRPEPDA